MQGTFGNSEAEGIWGHLSSAFLVSLVFLQIQKPVVKTDMEQLAQELEGLAQAQVRRERRPFSQTAIKKIWAGGTRNAGVGERAGTEAGDRGPQPWVLRPSTPLLDLRGLQLQFSFRPCCPLAV